MTALQFPIGSYLKTKTLQFRNLSAAASVLVL
jgi:hypothetical protein